MVSKLKIDREMIDKDVKPVVIDIGTSKTSLECMNALRFVAEVIGIEDPILYGGALRDAVLSNQLGKEIEPNDFDFITDLKKNILMPILQRLKNLEIGGDIHSFSFESFEDIEGFTISFFRGNKKFDLKIIDANVSVEFMAVYGDAPINSIAMGKNGAVIAHPNLEQDLKNKVYRVRVADNDEFDISRRRYFMLKNRPEFEGLVIEDMALKTPSISPEGKLLPPHNKK